MATHLHWRTLSTCLALAKMISFQALYETGGRSPTRHPKISDVVLHLIPIGDRLDCGGFIAPNDDFGGRSVLAGCFPRITREELQVPLIRHW